MKEADGSMEGGFFEVPKKLIPVPWNVMNENPAAKAACRRGGIIHLA